MRTMQEKLLDMVNTVVDSGSDSRVEVVRTTNYANAGVLWLQTALQTHAKITYDFQSDRWSVTIETDLLDLRDLFDTAKERNVGKAKAVFSMGYEEGARISAVMHAIRSIAVEAAKDDDV